MSVHDFGSTVEEVQQKLSEILPLVDAGENQAEQTAAAIQESGPAWNATIEDAAANCQADASLGADALASLSQARDDAVESLESLTDSLNGQATRVQQTFEEIASNIATAQQQLDSGSEQLDSAATELEAHFDEAAQLARSLLDELASAEESLHNAEDAFSLDNQQQATHLNEAGGQFRQGLDAFRTELENTHANALEQELEQVDEMAQALLSGIQQALDEGRQESESCFAEFSEDVAVVAESFAAQQGAIASQLAEQLDQDGALDRRLVQSVDELVEHGLETVGSEVAETVVVGGMLLHALIVLPPLLQGIGTARALARRINEAL
jgi:chromosome segregation ATPase